MKISIANIHTLTIGACTEKLVPVATCIYDVNVVFIGAPQLEERRASKSVDEDDDVYDIYVLLRAGACCRVRCEIDVKMFGI